MTDVRIEKCYGDSRYKVSVTTSDGYLVFECNSIFLKNSNSTLMKSRTIWFSMDRIYDKNDFKPESIISIVCFDKCYYDSGLIDMNGIHMNFGDMSCLNTEHFIDLKDERIAKEKAEADRLNREMFEKLSEDLDTSDEINEDYNNGPYALIHNGQVYGPFVLRTLAKEFYESYLYQEGEYQIMRMELLSDYKS